MRYIRIYLLLMRLNFSRLFAYRVNFINGIISSIVWSSFIIISMILLTARSSSVFGWSRNELWVLAGTYNIVYGCYYLLFSRNFEEFSNNIHYGKLDTILTKPVDSQFLMTCWFVSFPNLFRFFLGMFFTTYVLMQMHIVFSLQFFFHFIMLLLMSLLLLYSFWFFVMTFTIWFTRLSNLIDLLYQINGIMRYPQEMYKSISPVVFLILFPLTFIIVSPAKALLHTVIAGDILWPLLFSLLFFFISRYFWRFALRFYTSASG